jgi:hypothetical protein
MRALPILASWLLAGCNLVLGLSEPQQQADGGGADMAIDAPQPFTVRIVINGTASVGPASTLGQVTSSPPGIDCVGGVTSDCEETFPPGTEVTLTASGGTAPIFTGLTGGGCNHETTTPCVISPATDVTVFARYFFQSNIIFTSTTTKNPGAWDSLAAIDTECDKLAADSGLPAPPYKAWISSSTATASQRIRALVGVGGGFPQGPWLRPDGNVFSPTIDALETGIIIFPPRLDELGAAVPEDVVVVTDTIGNGTAGTGAHCSDWASESGAPVLGGEATGATGRWTAGELVDCNETARVYCMNGANRQNDATAIPSQAVFVWVSQGTFTPGNGPGPADTLCANEAAAATPDPFPGSTGALITPGGSKSVKERYADFGFGDPPFRPDGLRLATTMANIFNGDLLPIAINVDAQRQYLDVPVWIGGNSFDVFTSDCAGWTSTAGFGTSRQAASTRGPAFAQQVSCSTPQHVICYAGQVFMAKPKH